jgi:nitronate monooxygenase
MAALHDRIQSFQARFGLQLPILLAPMAGASPPSMSIAVERAGSMGALGALLLQPAQIAAWCDEVRSVGSGRFQVNLWIPDPPPLRHAVREAAWREFLRAWGPEGTVDAADAGPPDFNGQCDALIAGRPQVASSIMGVFAPAMVSRLKSAGITWFANATTVAEARAAEAAGADVIVAQGAEAGGHRGSFDARHAERHQVGLFALLPAIADTVKLPVVATGGIADARGIAAALLLGASAVQIGTGLLRCPEEGLPSAWADALARTAPEDTVLTRAFSGRAGRAIATTYVQATQDPHAPPPAPYPVQRGLTAAMRRAAQSANDLSRMQAWAGQSAALAQAVPAAELLRNLWVGAQSLLS